MKTISWRAILGVLLILFGSVALLQALDVITLQGDISAWIMAAIFILGGLIFLYVLLQAPQTNWWAIIPAGIMVSIALLVGLSFLPGFDSPWLMFFGFAATFGAVALYTRQSNERFHWAWIPALVFVILGGLMGLNQFEMLKFILPLAMLVGGGFFVWRSLKAQ